MLCAWIFDHFLAETLHLVDLLLKLAYIWLFSSKGKICYVSQEWSFILIFRILSAKNWITLIIISIFFQVRNKFEMLYRICPIRTKIVIFRCAWIFFFSFFFLFFFRITNVISQSNMILRPFSVSNFLIGRTLTDQRFDWLIKSMRRVATWACDRQYTTS